MGYAIRMFCKATEECLVLQFIQGWWYQPRKTSAYIQDISPVVSGHFLEARGAERSS